MNEKIQERRSWAASPMRMQGRINDQASGFYNFLFRVIEFLEIKERKTWNERIERTADRGMYGQRVWERSGERQTGYRDRSAQKQRESIRPNNEMEDDITEQQKGFRNQCINFFLKWSFYMN